MIGKKKIAARVIVSLLGVAIVGASILLFLNQVAETPDGLPQYDQMLGYRTGQIANLPIPQNAEIIEEISVAAKRAVYQIVGMSPEDNPDNAYLQAVRESGWQLQETLAAHCYIFVKDSEQVQITILSDQLQIELITDSIQSFLETMSLDEKLGQLLLVGFVGTEVTSELQTLLQELQVGGVILFGRNIVSAEQLQTLTQAITTLAPKLTPFISIDEEGGRVSRLPNDVQASPSAATIASSGNPQFAYETAYELGLKLRALGVTMNHAPVLDIFSNPANTVIGDRAFGSDAQVVSEFGVATMQGLMAAKVIPTVKHFPGHGDTAIDSHFGLPIVTKELAELENFELVPFQAAINAKSEVVMVSHILLEQIDADVPATLSKTIITDMLRTKLGFTGIVMTDDMQMGAITEYFSVAQASVQSIQAGTDVLLIGNDVTIIQEVHQALKTAVAESQISEARIDESVYRILHLKQKYNLLEFADGK
ncbi:MAG: beta-N-acetylhexosaminidase [Culicoidibacterales bacterium]